LTTEKLIKINRNDTTRSSGTPSGFNTSHLNSQTIYEFVGEMSEGLSAKRPKCVGETSDPCRRNVSGSKSLSAKRLSAKRLIGETSAPQTAKIHRFVRFVMYCIITTCSVKCYWHCSDGTVHYKSDKMVNFCCFRCAITSPI